MDGLKARYEKVMREIAELAGASASLRPPGSGVTLIAVSKSQPVEQIRALYELGHRDFGENYVQELLEKAPRLRELGCREIRWHFIGHLQTNKVKAVVPWIHAIHSVDSEKLAGELSKRWQDLPERAGQPLPCFLEVNINGEASKSGVAERDALSLLVRLASRETSLRFEGLMAIPAAASGSPARAFAALRELALKCRPHTSAQLSMGMSGDYPIAIAQGATHVRVGTAIFGARLGLAGGRVT